MIGVNIHDYRRIILVGSGGSGKSWAAKRIARITGYRLFHLDKEFWQAGWVMPSNEERVARQQAMIAGDTWIIDGNYDSSMAERFAAADLVIFLDINRIVCLVSAMLRAGKNRDDMPGGLKEPGMLSKDSRDFYKWIWSYPTTGRRTVLALHQQHQDIAFLRVKTRHQMTQLLAQW
ncbi:MAG: hypothetical protein FWD75_04940 [Propionibacteriaceae bacterium]|nr:hypothetical protein [Propionibacteriaceae bacterium]